MTCFSLLGWHGDGDEGQEAMSLASALDLEPATTAGAATRKRYNKLSFIGRDEEGGDGCCYGFSIRPRDDVWCTRRERERELLNCLELALMKNDELGG